MFFRLLPPLSLILSFFVILFLYTKIAGPIPFSVFSVTTQKSTTFDVSAQGKSEVLPDIAVVTAGIVAQGASVKTAQDAVNSVINKVSEGIKKAGVDAKDIKTVNYNINPVYDFSGGRQKITGYTGNTNLQIKIRNLDQVNNVIDIATANGANEVSGLSFDVDDRAKGEDEARQKAVSEAKRTAEQAAKTAGFTLGRIINYSENFGGGIRPMPVLMKQEGRAQDTASTSVEPGSSEIIVNVTLSYEIR